MRHINALPLEPSSPKDRYCPMCDGWHSYGETMRHARLQATLTGKAKAGRDIGPEEAHARNVLAITARIHKREQRTRAISKELKQLRADNRRDRRELRMVLQRDASMTEAGLDTAGKADAIDASLHKQER